MIKYVGLFLCMPIFFFKPAFAQFDFNKNCVAAYTEIINLRLDSAKILIYNEQDSNPNNHIIALLNNYIDFIEVYLFEDKASFDRLIKNKNDRLDLIKSTEESPYKRYIQAEIHLHSAFAKLKYGEYFTGLLDVRRSYNLANENYRRYPHFKPNLKLIGVLNTLLGVVPGKLKWGLQLIGLRGDLVYGMETLKQLSHDEFIYKTETTILYASMLLYLEKKSDKAYSILKQSNFPIESNLLSHYSYATMALYSKHTDEAISTLNKSINNFTPNKGYSPFPYLHYLAGMAALNQLDTNAIRYFKTYLQLYKGANHIKSTYQKLAWIELIKGDTTGYQNYIDTIGKYGIAQIDADKQAQKAFDLKEIPNVNLLKVRLLFDGGYYNKALLIINSITEKELPNFATQLEWIYRKGRIYDEMGNNAAAVDAYKKTIEKGEKSYFYYSANASLHLGYLYEKTGDIELAINYFEKSMNMKNHEYKNSIDQKAKAALQRIKK